MVRHAAAILGEQQTKPEQLLPIMCNIQGVSAFGGKRMKCHRYGSGHLSWCGECEGCKESESMYYPTAVRVMPATHDILDHFSAAELRQYAKALRLQAGKSKKDIIANLLASDKASVCVSLGD